MQQHIPYGLVTKESGLKAGKRESEDGNVAW
jgi:hypothetical protein